MKKSISVSALAGSVLAAISTLPNTALAYERESSAPDGSMVVTYTANNTQKGIDDIKNVLKKAREDFANPDSVNKLISDYTTSPLAISSVSITTTSEIQRALRNASSQDLQEIQDNVQQLSALLQQQGIVFSVGETFGDVIGVGTEQTQTEMTPESIDTIEELKNSLPFATLTYTGKKEKKFGTITLTQEDSVMFLPHEDSEHSGQAKISIKTIDKKSKKGKKGKNITFVMAKVWHNGKEVEMPIGTIEKGTVKISENFTLTKPETSFNVVKFSEATTIFDDFIKNLSDRNAFAPSVFFDGSDLYQSFLDNPQSEQMKKMLALPAFTQKFEKAQNEQKNKLVSSATTIFLAEIQKLSSSPEIAQLCSSLSKNVITSPTDTDIKTLGGIGEKTIAALGCEVRESQISLYGVPLDMKKIEAQLSALDNSLSLSKSLTTQPLQENLSESSDANIVPWVVVVVGILIFLGLIIASIRSNSGYRSTVT